MLSRAIFSPRTRLGVPSQFGAVQWTNSGLQRQLPTIRRDVLQRRSMSRYQVFRERFTILYRANPITLPLAIASLGLVFGCMGYLSYGYFFYIQPIDHAYPEKVAKYLKRGIYHTGLEPDLQKALKFFQLALEATVEENMNPFSDEVIGIKLRIAKVLEENGQITTEVRVLELLRRDIRRWIEMFGDRKDARKHRTRLLRKEVQICVKLGQLYSSSEMDDLDEAEKILTEGVETALVESRRREMGDVKDEDEGPWLSNEEMGGTLEELAHHFEGKGRYSLSSPLFLRALTLNPPPCHAAMLMNNLATSLAQTVPDSTFGPSTSRSALISNATAWAEKAFSVASEVKAEERTEECGHCCAVAAHNLGEFAEMEGLWEKARTQYIKAASLAKEVGYNEGRQRAGEALRRLDKEGR